MHFHLFICLCPYFRFVGDGRWYILFECRTLPSPGHLTPDVFPREHFSPDICPPYIFMGRTSAPGKTFVEDIFPFLLNRTFEEYYEVLGDFRVLTLSQTYLLAKLGLLIAGR